MNAVTAHPLRPIRFGGTTVDVERRADGTVIVRPCAPLSPYPDRLSDLFVHWAETAPDRVFVAERKANDGWRSVTYGEALPVVLSLGTALLKRGLSAERPLAILSGNSVDHALLALAALHAGVPYCAISPAYSLVSKDHGKLKHAIALLTPGLVYVEDADDYAGALNDAVATDIEVVASRGQAGVRPVTPLAALLREVDGPAVAAAHAATGPDTIAKFLLTSGSTGVPKAVINTQRMLSANQVMLRETLAFLKDEPPVIVDWLPWNHTFGGNHNVGLTIFNGGSLYIDDGKPVPGGIEATVRNLREIAPTVYFNVPKGYESLVAHLRTDEVLRRSFFARLHCMFFAGASLASHVWRALDEIAVMETGHRIPMLTGLGSTETAPFSMSVTPETSRSGHVGLPVPGNEIKLVPSGAKLEVRVRGPNVTPGYWRQPEATAAAFDEEGFYKFGDALKPVDPNDFGRGFDFDGRIAEDFKLATGTWVSVGPMRARVVTALEPLVRDVVLAGIDRDDLSAILILDLEGVRDACPNLSPANDLKTIAADPALRQMLQTKLDALARTATGSATRVTRAVILDAAPSIDRGEITDKGSINQRAMLDHRAGLVAELYADPPLPHILVASQAT
ncbi:feruloyl-CoA synthase [Phreatobacter aquaticus]|uniref:Feruloyl-CoA synthase n=1 Tax=Phreatobacter aquaticus TaxID=2570229 RepID=A0A4D7QN03_9HYPH|nr:feruloyl-CoA synthase [Phreatobacter aquaticus]QCK85552.1 feruloyl-CoA synthase [Phreatobacter aquaticus]